MLPDIFILVNKDFQKVVNFFEEKSAPTSPPPEKMLVTSMAGLVF